MSARKRAEEAVEARIVDAVNARVKGESTAVADERVAMLSEELDRARSDASCTPPRLLGTPRGMGWELRDANEALEEKLEASLRLQAMAEAWAETASELWKLYGCPAGRPRTRTISVSRSSRKGLAVAEGLRADASRQVTEKSQEVEKVHSTSKALGDEADDTRKELEDVVKEKNDLRRRVVEAEQAVLDSRRVLEAQVQKLEGQLSLRRVFCLSRKIWRSRPWRGSKRYRRRRAPSKRLIKIDWRPRHYERRRPRTGRWPSRRGATPRRRVVIWRRRGATPRRSPRHRRASSWSREATILWRLRRRRRMRRRRRCRKTRLH